MSICNGRLRIGTTDGGTPHCPFERDRHWFTPGWDIGTTQPGSSGSPLFDKDQLFIGALTGGGSECKTPEKEDFFYAFYKLARLETPGSRDIMQALNPNGKNTQRCEAYDPHKAGGQVFRISHISGLHEKDSLHRVLSKITRDKLLDTSHGTNAIGERFKVGEGVEMLGFYTMLKAKEITLPEQPIKYAIHIKDAQAPLVEGEISLQNLVTYTGYDIGHSPKKRSSAPYIEVYTSLPTPLKSDTNREYIIALDINSIAPSLTPLVQDKSGERNTLYYRRGDRWEAASTLSAPFAAGAAMWIDPLLTAREEDFPNDDDKQAQLFTIKNSYANNIVIRINRESTGTNETPSTLEVFDLSGRKLYEKTFTTPLHTLPRAPFEGLGVLIFRVRRGGEEKSINAYFPTV